ncbi:hypothetical protein B296_00041331, partial [Ensete ventricosum]
RAAFSRLGCAASMGSAEGTLVRHPLSTAASQRPLPPAHTLQRAGFACVRRHSPVSPPPPPPARAPPLSPSSSGPRRSTGFDRSLTYVLTHSSAPPPEHEASPSSPPSRTPTPLHWEHQHRRKSPRTGNMFPGNGGWISTWMNQPPLPDLNIYSFSADVAKVPFPLFFLSLATGRD